MDARSVAELLDRTRKRLDPVSDTPGLEAELLVVSVLGTTREHVLAHPEEEVGASAVQSLERLVERRLAGEALPYILGWWEFYGRRFRLAPSVLIPRPETELLVEQAISFLKGRATASGVDVGTGCGCIAVTLAAEFPGLKMIAADISLPALQVAATNARLHGVQQRVRLVACDLTTPFGNGFDLVCANLPYIPRSRLAQLEVARREPLLALDGGEDGLLLIRGLLTGLPRLLAPGGMALLEIDETQGEAAAVLAQRLAIGEVEVRRDLAGRDRLLIIRREVQR